MKSHLHIYLFSLIFQVNYFPSRFDTVRHAEKVPIPPRVLTGYREKVSILKLEQYAIMFQYALVATLCLAISIALMYCICG